MTEPENRVFLGSPKTCLENSLSIRRLISGEKGKNGSAVGRPDTQAIWKKFKRLCQQGSPAHELHSERHFLEARFRFLLVWCRLNSMRLLRVVFSSQQLR